LNWRRGLNFWHVLLLVANGLLLLAIIQVWWGSDVILTRSQAGKRPKVPTAPVMRDTQALGAFRVVSAKNLFSEDRTGPDPGRPAAKQDSLEGRKLLGTIIIGNERAAMIGAQTVVRGRHEQQVEVVRLGEEWGGFKVVEISSENVVFEGKDGKKTLNFPE
jgi:hypothetical protein